MCSNPEISQTLRFKFLDTYTENKDILLLKIFIYLFIYMIIKISQRRKLLLISFYIYYNVQLIQNIL